MTLRICLLVLGPEQLKEVLFVDDTSPTRGQLQTHMVIEVFSLDRCLGLLVLLVNLRVDFGEAEIRESGGPVCSISDL